MNFFLFLGINRSKNQEIMNMLKKENLKYKVLT